MLYHSGVCECGSDPQFDCPHCDNSPYYPSDSELLAEMRAQAEQGQMMQLAGMEMTYCSECPW